LRREREHHLDEARLSGELEIAAQVQQGPFPRVVPEERGLDYAGICRPALGGSGDHYDFLALGDGKLGLLLADVSGDWLLIYSDGISEAATEGGEDFGDYGLFDSLARLGTGTAAEVCEGVVDEVRNHLREQRQPDDITLIAVKVL
jgi:serine phosphatase RsbU (regulator of sigma subunit)